MIDKAATNISKSKFDITKKIIQNLINQMVLNK